MKKSPFTVARRVLWVLRHYASSLGIILRQTIKSDVVDYYNFIGTDLVNFRGSEFLDFEKPIWLNLGLWKNAHTYEDACMDLARLLGQTAELSPYDIVLDVGNGFAEQDILFLKEFNVGSITGINISPMQVEFAQRKLAFHGVTDKVKLVVGSATEMKFPDNCFDKVVSLEAACHFSTREDFFKEAWRVLKPGGKLALTDLIPLPDQTRNGLVARLERRFNSFPEQNFYGRDIYSEKLLAIGFQDVAVTSIRNHVFPGMSKFMKRRKTGEPAHEILITITSEEEADCVGSEIWKNQGMGDYILASATKPKI